MIASTITLSRPNGRCHSRPKPCFLVSLKRPLRNLNKPLKLPRRRSRPGAALPCSHDNDSLSSMPARRFHCLRAIEPVILFSDFRLKYGKTQMPLLTSLFSSKERLSQVCKPAARDHHSVHLPVSAQMRMVTFSEDFKWLNLPATSLQPSWAIRLRYPGIWTPRPDAFL